MINKATNLSNMVSRNSASTSNLDRQSRIIEIPKQVTIIKPVSNKYIVKQKPKCNTNTPTSPPKDTLGKHVLKTLILSTEYAGFVSLFMIATGFLGVIHFKAPLSTQLWAKPAGLLSILLAAPAFPIVSTVKLFNFIKVSHPPGTVLNQMRQVLLDIKFVVGEDYLPTIQQVYNDLTTRGTIK